MGDPGSPSEWRRLAPGLLVAAALHGGIILGLALKFGQPLQVIAAPPSLAVELVPLPPSPAPQPPRPQRQPDQPQPTPAPPTPPSPLDKLKLPTALAHDDVTLPPPAVSKPPPPAAPAAPDVPVQAAAVKQADRDRTASATNSDANAKPNWESMVLARLEAAKRYPASARFAHEEATIVVRFTVSRAGKVRDVRIVGRSPFVDLEEETLDLLHRVRLPPPPASIGDQDLALTVPIEFSISTAR